VSIKIDDEDFSQNGEEKVVLNLLHKISQNSKSNVTLDKWCVEFGAWDGIRGSNTYNLIRKYGYRSVQIEPDKIKFEKLVFNVSDPKHILINCFVGLEKHNSLDALLEQTCIPREFDFLSIDIDGMDYWIWSSITYYKPKIVCIEFNPSIPTHIPYIQDKDFQVNQGSSARSINELAQQKGYFLAAATHCNLFYVDSQYKELIYPNEEDFQLKDLVRKKFPDVYVFVGYDGSLHLSEKLLLPWHDLEVDELSLQFLPRIIRTNLPDYTRIQRIFFLLFRIKMNGLRWGIIQIKKIIIRTLKPRV